MSNYPAATFDLTLEVDGVRFPCVSAIVNYSLNTVPTARCAIASGFEASSGKLSTIHNRLDSDGRLKKAKIIFRGNGAYANNQTWPSQDVVIFEGYVIGSGYSRVSGNLNSFVELKHWLSDLDFGSALSATTHTQSISQYTYPAALQPGLAAGSGIKSSTLAYYQFGGLIRPELISKDMWANVFKPMLGNLASQEPLRLSGTLSACFGGSFDNEDTVRAALARIEGITEVDASLDSPHSPYTPPLTFDNNKVGQFSGTLVSALQEFVGQTSIDTLYGQTLWNLLINHYGADLLFAVVPQPEKAIVIPVNPCYRTPYSRVIAANDYNRIRMQGQRDRPLRGVGLRCNTFFHNGTTPDSVNNFQTEIGIGGCFAPAELETLGGLIKVVQAPKWIEKLGSAGYSASATSGIAGGVPTGSATTPVTSTDSKLNGHPDGQTRNDSYRAASEIADAYAQYLFLLENLRGRSVIVSGRLRFDLAPGSIVKVESATGATGDNLSADVIGCIAAVSINLDANSGTGGTAFQLIYPRTVAENETDLTSMPFHPIYTSNFQGAPLVDALAF